MGKDKTVSHDQSIAEYRKLILEMSKFDTKALSEDVEGYSKFVSQVSQGMRLHIESLRKDRVSMSNSFEDSFTDSEPLSLSVRMAVVACVNTLVMLLSTATPETQASVMAMLLNTVSQAYPLSLVGNNRIHPDVEKSITTIYDFLQRVVLPPLTPQIPFHRMDGTKEAALLIMFRLGVARGSLCDLVSLVSTLRTVSFRSQDENDIIESSFFDECLDQLIGTTLSDINRALRHAKDPKESRHSRRRRFAARMRRKRRVDASIRSNSTSAPLTQQWRSKQELHLAMMSDDGGMSDTSYGSESGYTDTMNDRDSLCSRDDMDEEDEQEEEDVRDFDFLNDLKHGLPAFPVSPRQALLMFLPSMEGDNENLRACCLGAAVMSQMERIGSTFMFDDGKRPIDDGRYVNYLLAVHTSTIYKPLCVDLIGPSIRNLHSLIRDSSALYFDSSSITGVDESVKMRYTCDMYILLSALRLLSVQLFQVQYKPACDGRTLEDVCDLIGVPIAEVAQIRELLLSMMCTAACERSHLSSRYAPFITPEIQHACSAVLKAGMHFLFPTPQKLKLVFDYCGMQPAHDHINVGHMSGDRILGERYVIQKMSSKKKKRKQNDDEDLNVYEGFLNTMMDAVTTADFGIELADYISDPTRSFQRSTVDETGVSPEQLLSTISKAIQLNELVHLEWLSKLEEGKEGYNEEAPMSRKLLKLTEFVAICQNYVFEELGHALHTLRDVTGKLSTAGASPSEKNDTGKEQKQSQDGTSGDGAGAPENAVNTGSADSLPDMADKGCGQSNGGMLNGSNAQSEVSRLASKNEEGDGTDTNVEYLKQKVSLLLTYSIQHIREVFFASRMTAARFKKFLSSKRPTPLGRIYCTSFVQDSSMLEVIAHQLLIILPSITPQVLLFDNSYLVHKFAFLSLSNVTSFLEAFEPLHTYLKQWDTDEENRSKEESRKAEEYDEADSVDRMWPPLYTRRRFFETPHPCMASFKMQLSAGEYATGPLLVEFDPITKTHPDSDDTFTVTASGEEQLNTEDGYLCDDAVVSLDFTYDHSKIQNRNRENLYGARVSVSALCELRTSEWASNVATNAAIACSKICFQLDYRPLSPSEKQLFDSAKLGFSVFDAGSENIFFFGLLPDQRANLVEAGLLSPSIVQALRDSNASLQSAKEGYLQNLKEIFSVPSVVSSSADQGRNILHIDFVDHLLDGPDLSDSVPLSGVDGHSLAAHFMAKMLKRFPNRTPQQASMRDTVARIVSNLLAVFLHHTDRVKDAVSFAQSKSKHPSDALTSVWKSAWKIQGVMTALRAKDGSTAPVEAFASNVQSICRLLVSVAPSIRCHPFFDVNGNELHVVSSTDHLLVENDVESTATLDDSKETDSDFSSLSRSQSRGSFTELGAQRGSQRSSGRRSFGDKVRRERAPSENGLAAVIHHEDEDGSSLTAGSSDKKHVASIRKVLLNIKHLLTSQQKQLSLQEEEGDPTSSKSVSPEETVINCLYNFCAFKGSLQREDGTESVQALRHVLLQQNSRALVSLVASRFLHFCIRTCDRLFSRWPTESFIACMASDMHSHLPLSGDSRPEQLRGYMSPFIFAADVALRHELRESFLGVMETLSNATQERSMNRRALVCFMGICAGRLGVADMQRVLDRGLEKTLAPFVKYPGVNASVLKPENASIAGDLLELVSEDGNVPRYRKKYDEEYINVYLCAQALHRVLFYSIDSVSAAHSPAVRNEIFSLPTGAATSKSVRPFPVHNHASGTHSRWLSHLSASLLEQTRYLRLLQEYEASQGMQREAARYLCSADLIPEKNVTCAVIHSLLSCDESVFDTWLRGEDMYEESSELGEPTVRVFSSLISRMCGSTASASCRFARLIIPRLLGTNGSSPRSFTENSNPSYSHGFVAWSRSILESDCPNAIAKQYLFPSPSELDAALQETLWVALRVVSSKSSMSQSLLASSSEWLSILMNTVSAGFNKSCSEACSTSPNTAIIALHTLSKVLRQVDPTNAVAETAQFSFDELHTGRKVTSSGVSLFIQFVLERIGEANGTWWAGLSIFLERALECNNTCVDDSIFANLCDFVDDCRHSDLVNTSADGLGFYVGFNSYGMHRSASDPNSLDFVGLPPQCCKAESANARHNGIDIGHIEAVASKKLRSVAVKYFDGAGFAAWTMVQYDPRRATVQDVMEMALKFQTRKSIQLMSRPYAAVIERELMSGGGSSCVVSRDELVSAYLQIGDVLIMFSERTEYDWQLDEDPLVWFNRYEDVVARATAIVPHAVAFYRSLCNNDRWGDTARGILRHHLSHLGEAEEKLSTAYDTFRERTDAALNIRCGELSLMRCVGSLAVLGEVHSQLNTGDRVRVVLKNGSQVEGALKSTKFVHPCDCSRPTNDTPEATSPCTPWCSSKEQQSPNIKTKVSQFFSSFEDVRTDVFFEKLESFHVLMPYHVDDDACPASCICKPFTGNNTATEVQVDEEKDSPSPLPASPSPSKIKVPTDSKSYLKYTSNKKKYGTLTRLQGKLLSLPKITTDNEIQAGEINRAVAATTDGSVSLESAKSDAGSNNEMGSKAGSSSITSGAEEKSNSMTVTLSRNLVIPASKAFQKYEMTRTKYGTVSQVKKKLLGLPKLSSAPSTPASSPFSEAAFGAKDSDKRALSSSPFAVPTSPFAGPLLFTPFSLEGEISDEDTELPSSGLLAGELLRKVPSNVLIKGVGKPKSKKESKNGKAPASHEVSTKDWVHNEHLQPATDKYVAKLRHWLYANSRYAGAPLAPDTSDVQARHTTQPVIITLDDGTERNILPKDILRLQPVSILAAHVAHSDDMGSAVSEVCEFLLTFMKKGLFRATKSHNDRKSPKMENEDNDENKNESKNENEESEEEDEEDHEVQLAVLSDSRISLLRGCFAVLRTALEPESACAARVDAATLFRVLEVTRTFVSLRKCATSFAQKWDDIFLGIPLLESRLAVLLGVDAGCIPTSLKEYKTLYLEGEEESVDRPVGSENSLVYYARKFSNPKSLNNSTSVLKSNNARPILASVGNSVSFDQEFTFTVLLQEDGSPVWFGNWMGMECSIQSPRTLFVNCPPTSRIVDVAVGSKEAFCLTSNGEVYSVTPRSSICISADVAFTSISACEDRLIGITSEGKLCKFHDISKPVAAKYSKKRAPFVVLNLDSFNHLGFVDVFATTKNFRFHFAVTATGRLLAFDDIPDDRGTANVFSVDSIEGLCIVKVVVTETRAVFLTNMGRVFCSDLRTVSNSTKCLPVEEMHTSHLAYAVDIAASASHISVFHVGVTGATPDATGAVGITSYTDAQTSNSLGTPWTTVRRGGKKNSPLPKFMSFLSLDRLFNCISCDNGAVYAYQSHEPISRRFPGLWPGTKVLPYPRNYYIPSVSLPNAVSSFSNSKQAMTDVSYATPAPSDVFFSDITAVSGKATRLCVGGSKKVLAANLVSSSQTFKSVMSLTDTVCGFTVSLQVGLQTTKPPKNSNGVDSEKATEFELLRITGKTTTESFTVLLTTAPNMDRKGTLSFESGALPSLVQDSENHTRSSVSCEVPIDCLEYDDCSAVDLQPLVVCVDTIEHVIRVSTRLGSKALQIPDNFNMEPYLSRRISIDGNVSPEALLSVRDVAMWAHPLEKEETDMLLWKNPLVAVSSHYALAREFKRQVSNHTIPEHSTPCHHFKMPWDNLQAAVKLHRKLEMEVDISDLLIRDCAPQLEYEMPRLFDNNGSQNGIASRTHSSSKAKRGRLSAGKSAEPVKGIFGAASSIPDFDSPVTFGDNSNSFGSFSTDVASFSAEMKDSDAQTTSNAGGEKKTESSEKSEKDAKYFYENEFVVHIRFRPFADSNVPLFSLLWRNTEGTITDLYREISSGDFIVNSSHCGDQFREKFKIHHTDQWMSLVVSQTKHQVNLWIDEHCIYSRASIGRLGEIHVGTTAVVVSNIEFAPNAKFLLTGLNLGHSLRISDTGKSSRFVHPDVLYIAAATSVKCALETETTVVNLEKASLCRAYLQVLPKAGVIRPVSHQRHNEAKRKTLAISSLFSSSISPVIGSIPLQSNQFVVHMYNMCMAVKTPGDPLPRLDFNSLPLSPSRFFPFTARDRGVVGSILELVTNFKIVDERPLRYHSVKFLSWLESLQSHSYWLCDRAYELSSDTALAALSQLSNSISDWDQSVDGDKSTTADSIMDTLMSLLWDVSASPSKSMQLVCEICEQLLMFEFSSAVSSSLAAVQETPLADISAVVFEMPFHFTTRCVTQAYACLCTELLRDAYDRSGSAQNIAIRSALLLLLAVQNVSRSVYADYCRIWKHNREEEDSTICFQDIRELVVRGAVMSKMLSIHTDSVFPLLQKSVSRELHPMMAEAVVSMMLRTLRSACEWNELFIEQNCVIVSLVQSLHRGATGTGATSPLGFFPSEEPQFFRLVMHDFAVASTDPSQPALNPLGGFSMIQLHRRKLDSPWYQKCAEDVEETLPYVEIDFLLKKIASQRLSPKPISFSDGSLVKSSSNEHMFIVLDTLLSLAGRPRSNSALEASTDGKPRRRPIPLKMLLVISEKNPKFASLLRADLSTYSSATIATMLADPAALRTMRMSEYGGNGGPVPLANDDEVVLTEDEEKRAVQLNASLLRIVSSVAPSTVEMLDMDRDLFEAGMWDEEAIAFTNRVIEEFGFTIYLERRSTVTNSIRNIAKRIVVRQRRSQSLPNSSSSTSISALNATTATPMFSEEKSPLQNMNNPFSSSTSSLGGVIDGADAMDSSDRAYINRYYTMMEPFHRRWAADVELSSLMDVCSVVDPTLDVVSRYPALSHLTLYQLQLRAQMLTVLREEFAPLLSTPWADLSFAPDISVIADSVRRVTYALPRTVKRAYIKRFDGEHISNKPMVAISRFRAARLSMFSRTDWQLKESVFGQLMNRINSLNESRPKPLFSVRYGVRPFYVKFDGEASIDDGGPFNEVLSWVCSELMLEPRTQSSSESKEQEEKDMDGGVPSLQQGLDGGVSQSNSTFKNVVPLFVKSPNSVGDIGLNRDTIVPNPSLPQSKLYKDGYFFVGQLIGFALRTGFHLELSFPPFVWKRLLNQPVGRPDIVTYDHHAFNIIDEISRLESQLLSSEEVQNDDGVVDSVALKALFRDRIDMRFEVVGSDGKLAELFPGSREISVTWNNRQEYVSSIVQFRLHELDFACDAMRAGLNSVMPRAGLSVLSWQELAQSVCGVAKINIDFLKENTVYDGYSSNDQTIKWFWDVLNKDFSQDDRVKFLRFVWGRSRLPLTSKAFVQKFKISPHSASASSNADMYLPEAHTCYFELDLPQYSSRAVLLNKLMFAITHCVSIDTDGQPPLGNSVNLLSNEPMHVHHISGEVGSDDEDDYEDDEEDDEDYEEEYEEEEYYYDPYQDGGRMILDSFNYFYG